MRTILLSLVLLYCVATTLAVVRAQNEKLNQNIDPPNYSYCQAGFPDPNTYPVPSNARLVSVTLLTRHGDRTPVASAPSDPVKFNVCDKTAVSGFHAPQASFGRLIQKRPVLNTDANPFAKLMFGGTCVQGQLTTIGSNQLMQLGANLRAIYVDKLKVLPSTYSATNTSLYVRSTDVWRTQQSAESVLSGLYPSSSVLDDAVPIYTYPSEVDSLAPNTGACPALAKLYSEMYASDPWKRHLTDNDDLFDLLNTVYNTASLANWQYTFDHFFDNLRGRQCHSLPLPCSADGKKCVPPEQAQRVYDQANWEWQYTYALYNQKMTSRLGIGILLNLISEVMLSHVNGVPSSIGSPAFTFFSGHDTTIAPILGALNFNNFLWPPYASNIIFELWQSNAADSSYSAPLTGYFVRFMYNGQLLAIPAAGCTDPNQCSLSSFIDYLHTIISDDILQECRPSQ